MCAYMKSHRVCVAGYRSNIAAGTCYINKRCVTLFETRTLIICTVSVCVYVFFSHTTIFFMFPNYRDVLAQHQISNNYVFDFQTRSAPLTVLSTCPGSSSRVSVCYTRKVSFGRSGDKYGTPSPLIDQRLFIPNYLLSVKKTMQQRKHKYSALERNTIKKQSYT